MALDKQKGYVYAKEFNLNSINDNLQAYKLMTKQFNQCDLKSTINNQGLDKGKIYGSLITMHRRPSTIRNKKTIPTRNQKYRRRRRRPHTRNSENACGHVICDKVETNCVPSDSTRDNTSTKHSLPTDESNVHHQKRLQLPDMFLNDVDQVQSENHDNSTSSKAEEESNYFGLVSYSDSSYESSDLSESCQNSDQNMVMNHQIREIATDAKINPNLPAKPTYNFIKNKWEQNDCSLSSFKCWKCRRIGHLASDCTLSCDMVYQISRPLPSGAAEYEQETNTAKYSTLLNQNQFYNKRNIKKLIRDPSCSVCAAATNIVLCLTCDTMICDGNGHLVSHLLEYPDHNKLFSFKLGRLIKCCKPTCNVTNIYKLRKCSICLDKFFSRHYNMINALWSRTGLRNIPNAVCCDDHFQWHRMNCGTVGEETFLDREFFSNIKISNRDNFVSEFFF